jgi:hypothetical protein
MFVLADRIFQRAVERRIQELGLKAEIRDPDMRPVYYDNLPGTEADFRRIDAEVENVRSLIQYFGITPDPEGLSEPIRLTQRAAGKLCTGQSVSDSSFGEGYVAQPVLDEVYGSQSYLERWTGLAATDFKRTFIDTFPSVVSNQFLICLALRGALEAQQGLWQNARANALHVAEEAMISLQQEPMSEREWTVTFTVVAAVATVAAPVFPGAALGLALVDGAASIVGPFRPSHRSVRSRHTPFPKFSSRSAMRSGSSPTMSATRKRSSRIR